jgi:hypothetical protein
MTLPPWLAFGPHWLLPAMEIGLLGALVASSPGRLERRSAALRAGGLTLAGLLSLTNATFAILLVGDLARGGGTRSAAALLLAGGALWTANVLIFALWYWELDRGGPAPRRADLPRLRVPADAAARPGPAGLEAGLHRLPVPVVHERHFLLGQRRGAADPLGEAHDDAPVGHLGGSHRPCHRPRGQHPRLTDGTYIEWSSRFDCDEADEDKTVAQIRDGVLVPGLKVLGQRFGPGIRDAARSDAVSSGA